MRCTRAEARVRGKLAAELPHMPSSANAYDPSGIATGQGEEMRRVLVQQ